MGLNCVAGTTENDEDEGIGLVLYVNSESNLIVWKMSNGTKQGTEVPLTTDYKSMLKSEFENKTGITIDYIIIHPYTGETIDIESSITINSGDTPEETLYFKHELPTAGQFLIAKYDTGSKTLMLGSNSSGQFMCIINSAGKVITNQGPPPSTQSDNIKNVVEAANYEVETVTEWLLNLNVGDSVENWNAYITV